MFDMFFIYGCRYSFKKEIVGGLISNSVALLSDAAHMVNLNPI